ncbi:MAG: hypothetical protein N7Q72_02770, partial [Spiroplasma sp. Tabriz.8]|nr:hypothetical protein [Spiroplasma sp. Tabriz.8]
HFFYLFKLVHISYLIVTNANTLVILDQFFFMLITLLLLLLLLLFFNFLIHFSLPTSTSLLLVRFVLI